MSDNKKVDIRSEREQPNLADNSNIAVSADEISSVSGSIKTSKTSQRVSSSSERQIKFERAQKCLENAALVSKRIKEHRKATAELLGRPFEEDDGGDTASEMASTMSEKTGYSAATDTSTTLSVQDALNIPGISESLANTLKQKEILMERIKQYKEISKRPMKTSTVSKKDSTVPTKLDYKKTTVNTDTSQLINTIKEKENALSVMQVKMKAMETTILDLQEKINEKDQIIEAKNMATTLMSDTLSKKEQDSIVLLEDTKQQMTKMQENFVTMEAEWREEKQRLQNEIQMRDDKIKNLEEANTILEQSRFEISILHSQLAEELDSKKKEIAALQDRIEKLTEIPIHETVEKDTDTEQEKGSLEIANMVELSKKIELLEQLNCQIRQTNKELENKLANVNTEVKNNASPSKKGSPVPTRKGGRNTASKMKSPWSQLSSESLQQEIEKKSSKSDISKLEMLVQSLNKDILDKEYIISQKDALIRDLKTENEQNQVIIVDLKQRAHNRMAIDTNDIGICTDKIDLVESIPFVEDTVKTSDKSEKESAVEHSLVDIKELEEKLKAAQDQIELLNNEIDVANKNMIKVKSNHKLKLKQMQKTIDNFSKISDTNAEIVKLNEELHQLSQKVAELEEEKGNLQLHLVDYDSGRLTESDVYKKLVEMENLAEARLKAISVLEAQKFDLVQEHHLLQQKHMELEDKLADMSQFQNDQVCSEIKSVQLEEQIDGLIASRNEYELVIENLKLDKEQLHGTIKVLQDEKEVLIHKLDTYIQENIELTDKLEKLSAEKVSSAESIEIVESLTTQEKLELEEYNNDMIANKIVESNEEQLDTCNRNESVESLMAQSVELNKKIELFTQERQEVMEKINKIGIENEALQNTLEELNKQCNNFQNRIELLNVEKSELQSLNMDLSLQIEELKRERVEIMKESVEIVKPSVEEAIEGATVEIQTDDKSAGDKGTNRTKSVKQLTKEILKLKNTIKEREAEIGDCQMKILSLEEQQQKYHELIQSVATYEMKLKTVTEENIHLKDELDTLKKDKESEKDSLRYKHDIEFLQQEIQKVHQDYTATIKSRDARINELENHLLEYEKQIYNYVNTLQQKDKDISEYVNQITKLNDVSQKLKSTIELLEEEKAKDQNSELVKSLNKQITIYQKKLTELEDKMRVLEEEKVQLLSVKGVLENKNINIETELKKLQDNLTEKMNLIKEFQTHKQKQAEEISIVKHEAKERDEEIHEIKLQLRKESIENEKLRTTLAEKENNSKEFSQDYEETKEKLTKLTIEKDELAEQYLALETKNKELLEKLKKFAFNIKKKTSMYTELEGHFYEIQKELEAKNNQLEQLLIQVETIPNLQDKLKYTEEEISRLQMEKMLFEQQATNGLIEMQLEMKSLKEEVSMSKDELSQLGQCREALLNQLQMITDENVSLKTQNKFLSNKLVEFEIEQKNYMNFTTKISGLEADLNQKQVHFSELFSKLETQEQQYRQLQFGYDAKIQERDLYIESLESEINKYKNRICRLEETVSVMEDRRHSLERKADQLDVQLQEKQSAYSEYNSQEDELVTRLAVLMDHERVVEKQLHEVEGENKELQHKVQQLTEENQHMRKSLSDLQDRCNILHDKANKTESMETELSKCQSHVYELENNVKRITQDYHVLSVQKKQEIEELESEFNTQIENAIKEKKTICEKYEKLNEYVIELEGKIQEYRGNIENLKINIEELTKVNQNLAEKSHAKEISTQDYTEQYINEINKLNSALNNKSKEITELNTQIQTVKASNETIVQNLETDAADLRSTLQISQSQMEKQVNESDQLKKDYEKLWELLSEKDEQIKQLKDKTKLTFEMSIPKTEGMIISSTIEALSDQKGFDMSSLESQIVADASVSDNTTDAYVEQKVFEPSHHQKITSEEVIEPLIIPKKSYECHKEDLVKESDPFNSDEGWGLGECEDSGDIRSGISQLNDQILQLKKENDQLKKNFDNTNTKLLKALKKLKELKSANDMLTNELRTAQQMSQSDLLDNAIENELANNIQGLEKQLEELKTDLNKEKREKESLKKQNEVFSSANDRLTEMKEKMDNEIDLWKYKFKEANDKLSSMQWDAESKDFPDNKILQQKMSANISDSNEIIKLEKENEELTSMIDKLTLENKELDTQQIQLRSDINVLSKKLEDQNSSNDNVNTINARLLELQDKNDELNRCNATLNEKIQHFELKNIEASQNYTQLEEKITKLLENNKTLEGTNKELEEELRMCKLLENEANNKISLLVAEIENLKSNLHWHEQQLTINKSHTGDSLLWAEKFSAMEEQCSQLKLNLDKTNKKIAQLESENQVLEEKSKGQLDEFNNQIQNLNTEKEHLLSTLTDLRSSVSCAVDQRGFEISEIWKQHLAQREADFHKIEQDLKSQLSLSESKYEQLLDNVQSSSQEETNQLVMIEQVSSLQNKLQDKEEHLHNLQEKCSELMNQLEIERSKLEITYENKVSIQKEEFEKMIENLKVQCQEQSENYELTHKDLQTQLISSKANNDKLNLQIAELINRTKECEAMIEDLTNQLQIKDSEIYQKTHDFTVTLAQRNEEFENVRKQLIEYEKKVDDLSYEKEAELAVLRLKMHENGQTYETLRQEFEDEKTSLSEALNSKIIECTNLNKQIVELNQMLEEKSSNLIELQAALENQEVEIVTLKDEIASLQDALRSSSSKVNKHVTFASDTKPGTDNDQLQDTLNKELLDAVPKAELDLALYLLHQRDVRCEELTMELTQLLEERDTLQLRLSDSLRTYEDLKSKCKSAGLDMSMSSSQETISELPSFTVEREQQFVDTHRVHSSRSSSISDPDAEKPKLQAKLSELRTVRHSKDVTLRQDSEQRQLGMRLMQSDVANLPPEAFEQLAQAHHTLSRDSQSTSTVLLNWLRGKSTPKVVHM